MRSHWIHWTPTDACIYSRILLFQSTCFRLAASNRRQTQKNSERVRLNPGLSSLEENSKNKSEIRNKWQSLFKREYDNLYFAIGHRPSKTLLRKVWARTVMTAMEMKKKHQKWVPFLFEFHHNRVDTLRWHNSWHTLPFLHIFINPLDFLKM